MGFDIISFASGGTMDAASAWYNNRMAEKRQHEAQDFSAEQYAKRYQTQVADLKAAGLNPMMAYGQSPGSAPTSSAASSTGKLDLSGSYASTKLANAQADKIKQETANLEVEKTNLEATQDKLNQEIVRIGNEVMEIDQKIKSGRASEAETKMRTELIAQQIEYTKMQTQLAQQEKKIKTPEEIASSTQAAEVAAHVSRVLKPLIDAVNAALKK